MNSTLEGVAIMPLKRHEDSRGWLSEIFRRDELPEQLRPEMGYVSMTKPGVGRGPHEHREQTDLFYFGPESSFRLYLWDRRRNSTTSGKEETLDLISENGLIVIIPPGVVHGYKNVGDRDGLVFNFPNRLYGGPKKAGPVDEIRYEDDDSGDFSMDE